MCKIVLLLIKIPSVMVFKLSRISLLRVLRILPVTISELTLETVLARDKVERLNSFSRVTCINENINALAENILDHYPGSARCAGCPEIYHARFPVSVKFERK